MLRAGMIGAGGRAQAHYPLLDNFDDLSIEAVAELDADRMRRVVDTYGIPRAFNDHREMLDAVDPDVVYVVTLETQVTAIAVDCMKAGKHVFIEKPPGADSGETQTLLDVAEDNNVACMVGYQRRYAAVTPEAMRLVAERGPATLVVGEYHKNFLGRERPLTSTLWQDVTHIMDLVRFMAGSEVVEVTAYQDAFQSSWRNSYNGLIRFANDAVGIVTGNRPSGGRYMRTELHGIGVGCYMRVPTEIEVLRQRAIRDNLWGGLAGS